MNQIVMPPNTAASPTRSIVESRNAPHGPELPLRRASWPSSMSVKTKNVAIAAPGKSQPMGNSASALADTPAVPITVIMFGVTGVRASACTTGVNRRAKPGRRKFSMAGQDLTGRRITLARVARLGPAPSPVRYLADSPRGACGNAAVGLRLALRSSRQLIERKEATGVTETTGAGTGGRAPAAGQPGSIRNVVLVGHSGSGKTTLIEALLGYTGTIQRPGRVEEGTTVSDFDEVEIRQKRSVNLTLEPCVVDGITVNMLDTPGYADFTGDLRAGLRAADCALFVVAATDGVDGVTRLLWEECAAVGMPRAVVITKIDHGRADFDTVLAECQGAFGEGVLPLYLPVSSEGGVSGLIGLLSETLYDYSPGTRAASTVTTDDDIERMTLARDSLIEGIITESEDET